MTLISQELIINLRPSWPECRKLHSTDVLHFAAKWVCSLAHLRWIGMHIAQSNCGMRGEWHPLSYLNFIFIFIFREHKVVLDGDSLTSKSAVLRQLTKQTRRGVLMADGVSKKVDICCWKFFTLPKSYNRTGSILWTKEWKPSLQSGTGRRRYLWRPLVPR